MSERIPVFLTSLGTSNYRELHYKGYEGESGAAELCATRFIQLARLKALKLRGLESEHQYILLTPIAREKNWLDNGHDGAGSLPGLASSLAVEELRATALDIPNGSTQEEFWQIFATLVEKIPESADVYVDLTHGFRTIPILMMMALEYAEQAKDARVMELTYGADKDENGAAPTWNLAPFLVIRRWAAALQAFLEFGDTRPLGEVAKLPTNALGRQLGREMPSALGKLPRALERFGEMLLKCHAPGITQAAADLRRLTSDASHSSQHLQLRPLLHILHKLEASLADFPSEPNSSLDGLQAQRAAAAWCLKHRLAMQAYTFIREAFVSALELLASSSLERVSVDEVLGALEFRERSRKTAKKPDPGQVNDRALPTDSKLAPWIADILTGWDRKPPLPAHIWSEMLGVLSELIQRRNALDHAHTAGNSKAPASDQVLEQLGQRCLDVLKQIIEVLRLEEAARPEGGK